MHLLRRNDLVDVWATSRGDYRDSRLRGANQGPDAATLEQRWRTGGPVDRQDLEAAIRFHPSRDVVAQLCDMIRANDPHAARRILDNHFGPHSVLSDAELAFLGELAAHVKAERVGLGDPVPAFENEWFMILRNSAEEEVVPKIPFSRPWSEEEFRQAYARAQSDEERDDISGCWSFYCELTQDEG